MATNIVDKHPRERAVVSLVEFLKKKYPKKGFSISNNVEFVVTEECAMAAKAISSIKKDDILLVIPESSRLSLAIQGDFNDEVKRILKRIDRDLERFKEQPSFETCEISVAILVMLAAAIDEETEGSSLRSLQAATWPSIEDVQAQDLAPYWKEEQVNDVLPYSIVSELSKGRRSHLSSVFSEVIYPNTLKNPDKFINREIKKDEKNNDTQEEKLRKSFYYAFSICFSRAHEKHEGPEIIPLVDLFNGMDEEICSEGINVKLARGFWPFLHGSIYRNDFNLKCSAVYASRNIEAGEELIISYGDITASQFLAKYGSVPMKFIESPKIRDTVSVYCPPDIIPPRSDKLRMKALEEINGFPLEEFRSQRMPLAYFEPHTLMMYQHYGQEDEQLKMMRQFLILSHVVPNSVVENNIRTGRLQCNDINSIDICKALCDVVDHTIHQLGGSTTSHEDMSEANKLGTPTWKVAMLRTRISQRETLLVWRNLFLKNYGLLDCPYPVIPLNPCQSRSRGSCLICGKTYPIKVCTRCKSVWYCSREHQKTDWKKHKLECKAK